MTEGRIIRILLIGFVCAILVLGGPVSAGEQRISPDNGGSHISPRIDGNKVVWLDNNNQVIYLYDICSGTPAETISSLSEYPSNPQISPTYAVWENDYTQPQELVIYDSATGAETHLPHIIFSSGDTQQPAIMTSPDIYGHIIVFWAENPWPQVGQDSDEIWTYDLTSGKFTPVYQSLTGEWLERPRISGSHIVWADSVDGKHNVWLSGLTGGVNPQTPPKKISGASGDAKNPDIDGNLVVWQQTNPDTGKAEIIHYDITLDKKTTITDNSAINPKNPAISGDRIVWEDERNYDTASTDIYRYNIRTKTTDRITTDPYDQINPDVSKNYIVWQDERNGNHIYLYTDGSPDTFVDQFSCWLRLPEIPSQVETWFRHGGITLAPPPTGTPPPPTPTIIRKGHHGTLTASFTATPSSGEAPLKVSLDASGSQAGSSPIASYAWDFGDGMSGTGVSGSHTYASAGAYTIRLLIKDSAGQTDSYYRKVTVTGTQTGKNAEEATPVTYGPVVTTAKNVKLQPPEFTFRPDPGTGYVPFTVTCRANVISSIAPIASYKWDFGDGQTGSGQTVTHTYTAPGLYKIYITVTDSYGSSAYTKAEVLALSPTTAPTATPTSHANQPPAAVFTLTPTSGSAPLTVKFDASGSSDPDGSIASYAWDFGDGQSGSGKAPSHTYLKTGTMTVTLTVTDNNGSLAQVTHQVSIVK